MRKLTSIEVQEIEGGFTYTDTCGINGCQFSASAKYYELFSLGAAVLEVMQQISVHRRECHPLKDRQY